MGTHTMALPSFQPRETGISPLRAAQVAIVLFLLHRVGLILYRLYFDPLSKVPGPKLLAASSLPSRIQNKLLGTFVRSSTLHEKYGPVVRTSPTQLTIDGSIAWPEVFMRRPPKEEFGKVWQNYGIGPHALIGTDRENHRRQRRVLSHAFSAAALASQETYIQKYVDKLINVFGEHADQNKAIDVTLWYNNLTFDIIGELTFGESFGCMDNKDSVHPIVAMFFAGLRAAARDDFFRNFVLLRPLSLLLNRGDGKARDEVQRFSESRTEARMAQGTQSRTDFMTYIMRNNKDDQASMTHEEILAVCRVLVAAGTETTATTLAGFSFHVCNNKQVYATLVDEIRGAFATEDAIDIHSTARLPYLNACIEEILRLFPPVQDIPTRRSPGDFVAGYYVPKGTLISVNQWATTHSPRNFVDPEKFAPERWLSSTHPLHDARYNADNKAASRPFSAGPRDCIGKNLAYTEVRLVLARMFWNFDLVAVEGQDDWLRRQRVFTVVEKGPFLARLQRRSAVY